MASAFSEQNVIRVEKHIDIKAAPDTVFEAILEQNGPGFEHPDGSPMPLKIEAWPGGRWFRDMGNNTGHFWGHVQVIKPPTLLEMTGPMFMSYPVMSHVQYRLTEQNGGTHLMLLHRAIGEISPEHRTGVNTGWEYILKRIQSRSTK